MRVERLFVLVEEPSMEAALEELLPVMVREGVDIQVRSFRCKDALLKALPDRLRAYSEWLGESARVLVVVDRDDDDCIVLKQRLRSIARAAGLGTSGHARLGCATVINRIAIEELEAWFFGDWVAVCAAFDRMDANLPRKAAFRHSDAIAGGTWEALERELKRRGYYQAGLAKVDCARRVAAHMQPERNQSPSFRALRSALAAL